MRFVASSRTYICLVCGERHQVSPEEYKSIKDNPICDKCKESTFSENENIPQTTKPNVLDTFSNVVSGISLILDKTINKSDNTPDTSLKTAVHKISSTINTPSSIDEYNWKHIGCLGELYDNKKLGEWSSYVGLYMHKMNGEIMYIGRAIEYNNGGFRKRLSDYCRPNGSARVHPSGQKIFANRYNLQTYLLIVGTDAAAATKTKLLEEVYVAKYNPPWNDKLKTDK